MIRTIEKHQDIMKSLGAKLHEEKYYALFKEKRAILSFKISHFMRI